MNELISCIITTYNRDCNILKRAIDSVLNQTYKNIELIIVNDAPKNVVLANRIKNMITEYNVPYISYIIHEKNFGACKARNTGIIAAKGKYIALLDDDDEWIPEKLEKQISLFTDDRIGLVYCNSIIKKDGKEMIHKCVPKIESGNIIEALLERNFIGGNSFPLLKKDIIIRAGMYDENLKALQDLDMWIRIAQISKCIYCDKPLVINHISKTSITTVSDNRIQGYERTIQKYDKLYRQYPDIYHKRLLGIAGELLIAHKYHESFKYYKKALSINNMSIFNITIPAKCFALKMRKNIFKY